MSQEFFTVIVAVDNKNGIAKDNKIPWKLHEDLKYFSEITKKEYAPDTRNVVIMGRLTWESIPEKHRPLKDRINIVISSKYHKYSVDHDDIIPSFPEHPYYFSKSLGSALDSVRNKAVGKIFICGGSKLYEEAMNDFYCNEIILTRVYSDFNCDRFIPEIPSKFKITSCGELLKEECQPNYRFIRYSRFFPLDHTSPEYSYLNLVQRTLANGLERSDRTGTGTISQFGEKMIFDIHNDGFPILTTKKIPFQTVIKELLWFLSGDTNNHHLNDQDVHIWDLNTSRTFLDNRGLLDLEEGDIGAGYGHQWRHFNAEYTGFNTNYSNKGIDQIKEVIRQIKEEPTSRRIIFTGWNPSALNRMALPPCHGIVVQFYVQNNGLLDCQMYQRSMDVALGAPFNITSYALLLCMIAQITKLKPGKFIHIIGDCHVYRDHVDCMKEQLKRNPRPFPILKINPNVNDIDSFKLDDFELIEYRPYPALKMKMSV